MPLVVEPVLAMERFVEWLGYTNESRRMRGLSHRDRLLRAWLTGLPIIVLSVAESRGGYFAVAVVLTFVLGLASLPLGEMWTRAWILLVGYVFTLIGFAATFVFFSFHPSAWTGLAVVGLAEIIWGSSRSVPVAAHNR